MALNPLAAVADLSARGVYISDNEKAATALEVASAAIREAAGAVISQVESTLTFNPLYDTFLPLPGPITAVSEVTVNGVPTTSYDIEDGGLRLSSGWAAGEVVVTFTHGLATDPADIVDLTCQLAISWLEHAASGGGSTAGLASARVDDAAETYTDEAAGQISPVFIPAVTRTWLANRFGGGAQVVSFR